MKQTAIKKLQSTQHLTDVFFYFRLKQVQTLINQKTIEAPGENKKPRWKFIDNEIKRSQARQGDNQPPRL
jgi:hypothetical protein